MPPPPHRLHIFVLQAAVVLVSAYSQYPSCNRTFSCGDITDVTFPFTGGNRPSHCGLPEFSLTCRDGNITELIGGYRIVELNQTRKTITLSRSDLYNNSCPSEFRNDSLSSSLFSFNGPENEALNLFYGCNTTNMSITPTNLFSCNSTGLNYTNAYYLIGPVPSDPILGIVSCAENLDLLISRDVGTELAALNVSLEQALMMGFRVNYSVRDEKLCYDCNGIGGECGFDLRQDRFICSCGDGICSNFPPAAAPPEGSRNLSNIATPNTGRDIALFIAGAVLAGVGLGWLIFWCRQKRKQIVTFRSNDRDIATSPSTRVLLSLPPQVPSSPSQSLYLGAQVQVFAYDELEQATNNFDRLKELGDGGFGTVYHGELCDGRAVAVKRLHENNFKRMEQFMNEVEILASLRHQNLVTLYGRTSRQCRQLLLVYEYVPNGTVADHLHGTRATPGLLSWPIRLNVAIETADALSYLHKSEIIHRDVKTNNILLDNDFHVRVADFGLSRLFPNDVTHVSTAPQGTPGYVDPEYHQCYQLTEKSDVYSFGVVLVELISSLQAVDTNRNRHDINLSTMAINRIQSHTLHELVDSNLGFETDSRVRRMVTLVAELAFRCLQRERETRPSMVEVLEVLRRIGNEDLSSDKVEIVDMLMGDDECILPRSPDSPAH